MDYQDVVRAAGRLEGVAHRTPVHTSRTLNEWTGANLFFKCENFQRAGAFKFRGAYNALSSLDEGQRARGVLTFSSGNHAQALALAGLLLGVPTLIVMPRDAPEVKVEATRGYGAEIVLFDRDETTREELGRRLSEERNLTIVPPYDDERIVAGQGTCAQELFEEVGPLDVLVVPCGGGGLLSGSALSAQALSPGCRVVGVEPEAGDDGCRSFRAGVLQSVADPVTIADGARTPSLGVLTFAIIRELVSDIVSVSDGAIVRAMRPLWERMKLVVEPTGALGLAAILEGKVEAQGKRVGVILSGGNVDLAVVGRLFAN
ncbi:MAG TPA: threo-3-hydroxy-L-aspartate ammonia-lyase [Fimbriimonadaceae bacterium]|nr:threo-3-hydroxy-L-aspartate ammonia-lyase [Fimbriimonadaceae bacterium]HRJ96144.1 threo-3-hydroxy-L-aspartate ammonia-lyase [Fimbriimonadaceae bacterium]